MSKYQSLIDALAGVDGQLGQPSLHSGHVIYAETEEWCGVDINIKLSANKHISGPLARFIKEAANPATIRALLADLEMAEKDAERYRWLRNESWAGYNQSKRRPEVAESVVITRDGAGNVKTILAEDAMDAAIDAALAQMVGG